MSPSADIVAVPAAKAKAKTKRSKKHSKSNSGEKRKSENKKAKAAHTPAVVAAAAAVVVAAAGDSAAGGNVGVLRDDFTLADLAPLYGYGGKIKAVRDDFPLLGTEVYLDHAGASLASKSQMAEVTRVLTHNIHGNPHSENPSSLLSGEAVKRVRLLLLRFLNAPSDEYDVVFTANASGALKLVAEYHPWTADSYMFYSQRNHNSALGMREYCLARGGKTYTHWDVADVLAAIDGKRGFTPSPDAQHLLVFPGECNFSGLREPLDFINEFKATHPNVTVFVDSAALVAHKRVDLTATSADFMCCSFYKMCGYPTGLGALVARRDALAKLDKPYFGGGTVAFSIATENYHEKKDNYERWEDGTLNFLGIVALEAGLRHVVELSMEAVDRHSFAVTSYLIQQLRALKHTVVRDGVRTSIPGCELYTEVDVVYDIKRHGPLIAFNLLDADGRYVGFKDVERKAAKRHIHLRTGCFCNPGSCQRYLHLTADSIRKLIASGFVCGDDRMLVDGRPTGAVRVSCAYMTTYHDIDMLLDFIRDEYFRDEEHTTPRASTNELLAAAADECRATNVRVYPVVGCGGFDAKIWTLGAYGLQYNCEWMVAFEDGSPVGADMHEVLAGITATIDVDADVLSLSAEGMPQLDIGLTDYSEQAFDIPASGDSLSDEEDVEKSYAAHYWMVRHRGHRYGSVVSDWLREVLGFDCFLVRKKDTLHHISDLLSETTAVVEGAEGVETAAKKEPSVKKKKRAKETKKAKAARKEEKAAGKAARKAARKAAKAARKAARAAQKAIDADAHKVYGLQPQPFVLINAASLAALNETIDKHNAALSDESRTVAHVTPASFRANVVLGGADEFAQWEAMSVGEVQLRIVSSAAEYCAEPTARGALALLRELNGHTNGLATTVVYQAPLLQLETVQEGCLFVADRTEVSSFSEC